MNHSLTQGHSSVVPTRKRFVILLLLSLGVGSAYLSRNTTAANTTLEKDFHVSQTELGVILSAFGFGYFCTQVMGGWLGGRVGVRIVFPVCAGLWSCCAVWTSCAETGRELWWARLCLGLAQGVMVPCTGQALAAWFPVRARGRASSLPALCMQLGAVLAVFMTARLLITPGWRVAFRMYAGTGALWAVSFYLLFRNRPEEHTGVNAEELALIRDDLSLEPGVPRTVVVPPLEGWFQGAWRVVSSRSLLLISVREFFRAFSYAFIAQWLPKYLEKGRGLAPQEAGQLTGITLVAYCAGVLLGGMAVDWLYQGTGSKRISRGMFPAVAMTCCALCVGTSLTVRGFGPAVALIASGAFLAGLMITSVWAGILDIAGSRSGAVLGLMNMAGTAGDFSCNLGIGRLADLIEANGWGWNWLLWPVVVANLMGATCSALFDPNRTVAD